MLEQVLNAAWWNVNFMWHGLKGPFDICPDGIVIIHVEVHVG